MHPRIPLAFLAARAHCWLTVNLMVLKASPLPPWSRRIQKGVGGTAPELLKGLGRPCSFQLFEKPRLPVGTRPLAWPTQEGGVRGLSSISMTLKARNASTPSSIFFHRGGFQATREAGERWPWFPAPPARLCLAKAAAGVCLTDSTAWAGQKVLLFPKTKGLRPRFWVLAGDTRGQLP